MSERIEQELQTIAGELYLLRTALEEMLEFLKESQEANLRWGDNII